MTDVSLYLSVERSRLYLLLAAPDPVMRGLLAKQI
jgi:hypothetical protein